MDLNLIRVVLAILQFFACVVTIHFAQKAYRVASGMKNTVEEAFKLGVELGIEAEKNRVKIEILKDEICRIKMDALRSKPQTGKP